jgi:WXXGXW repeat (2 copies)
MRKSHIVGLVLFALLLMFVPARSSAQISVGVGIAVHIGPPALPVYEQPICPGAGYLWTPGYWAYGPDGYFWVPGTWVMAPEVGLLWTPGYWGWGAGGYFWHAGYWGPHVGFYGGINYGFGYGGVGFFGGRWNGGVFAYNTAVMHVDTTVIHTTYVDRTVINNVTVNNHVSFNGGAGGITARPTAEELAAEHERHVAPTEMQTQHEHAASTNRALLASENHGRPAIAATARPGEFSGHGVVAAGASHNRPPNAGSGHTNNAADAHKADRPPAHTESTRSDAPKANNAPKSQAHAENKPKTDNKPKTESKPKEEEKPHKG